MWLGLVAIFLFIFLIMLIQGNSSQRNIEDVEYENEEGRLVPASINFL